MSKLTEQLRAIKVYNLWELIEDGHPFVYTAKDPLGVSSVMLAVRGKELKDAAWYDDGCLSFIYSGIKERKKAIQEALDKVKELFPKLEMVKGPWGMTWVPKCDLDKAKKIIKENGRK